jgi:hypothetical protein
LGSSPHAQHSLASCLLLNKSRRTSTSIVNRGNSTSDTARLRACRLEGRDEQTALGNAELISSILAP